MLSKLNKLWYWVRFWFFKVYNNSPISFLAYCVDKNEIEWIAKICQECVLDPEFRQHNDLQVNLKFCSGPSVFIANVVPKYPLSWSKLAKQVSGVYLDYHSEANAAVVSLPRGKNKMIDSFYVEKVKKIHKVG